MCLRLVALAADSRPAFTELGVAGHIDETVRSTPTYSGACTTAQNPSADTAARGSRSVSPRQLTANLLSHLVEVEGIVTKTSLKRPKLVRSTHYCPKTGNFLQREYRDAASQEGLPTGTAYPTRDDDGNLLETEYGLSIYKDNQVITVQARPMCV